MTSADGRPAALARLSHGAADWSGLRVLVAGLGMSGFACADALLERGARVRVIDQREDRPQRERAVVLDTLGAQVDLGIGTDLGTDLGTDVGIGTDVDGGRPDLLVLTPSWPEGSPLPAALLAAGVPVWAEAELAWRLRPASDAAGWLTITGSRGKAGTAQLVAAMLRAGGRRAVAAGRTGGSLLEAVLHPVPYDLLAVQLSIFQLRWSGSIRPLAALCLNLAGEDLQPERRATRGRVYHLAEVACVYNRSDQLTEDLVREAEVIEGCRAVGFGLQVPAVAMLGLVEDVLCDRAFVAERATSAAELGVLADLRAATAGLLAPHLVANALAAAALARAAGVAPVAVREGIRQCPPLEHRLNLLAETAGVRWVDDSAATDPFAAEAALQAFEQVVWVAGGDRPRPDGELAELVSRNAQRLRAVLLIGPDRGRLRAALERHAPDVPVVEVEAGETGSMPVMEVVVARASQLAQAGDVVLLSPAFGPAPYASVQARGEAFAAARAGAAGAAAGAGEGDLP